MSLKKNEAPPGKMSLGDIYFILFRHKWKILFFSASGILAALTLLLCKPPLYESKAELDILYVVQGRSFNPNGEDPNTTVSPNGPGYGIILTELKILQSLDVIMDAVQTVGAEKILAKVGGGNNTNAAAGLIAKNLIVDSTPGNSVIDVTLQHPDPEMVQSILGEIIACYFKKHTQVHLGSVMSSDYSAQETNRLYKDLAQTKEELKNAKNTAGVFSIDEANKSYEEQLSQIRTRLFAAEAELVERKEVLKQISNIPSSDAPATNGSVATISPDKIQEYRNLCTRLDLLRKKEQELLMQYTDQSVPVKDVREQILANETLKQKLEAEEPRLAGLGVPSGQADGSAINLADNQAQISMLESKVNILNSQLSQVQSNAARIDESKATITELEERQHRQEAELEYFLRNLEQARLDGMLGAGKAPNIGIIQYPSSPVKQWPKKLKKKAAILAVGGIGFGVALAFLIELFLDRSLKRPVEIELKLGLPMFISIPDFSQKNHSSRAVIQNVPLLTDGTGKGASQNVAMVPWNRQNPLYRFWEGLRDRLIIHFEVKNVTHNPKLVAVTSCDRGAGVSSVAAGLAASLSETGDGNVLLVDMNTEGGAAQQFYKGKLGCSVDDVLESEARKGALIQKNLYIATQPMESSDKLPSVPAKHLMGLIPKLKASDYDYIIFDMPAVTQTSMTPRMARLMDMVLLVIESEKTNQEVAKKVVSLLAESKANVTTVLNKTRSYIPPKLYRENLNDV